jgi:hypothetical protein
LFTHRRREILENTVYCYTGVACTIGHSENPEKAVEERPSAAACPPPAAFHPAADNTITDKIAMALFLE